MKRNADSTRTTLGAVLLRLLSTSAPLDAQRNHLT